MPILRELEDGGETRAESPSLSHMLAEQRLRRACTRLEVGFADAVALVDFDPDADTAYWRYNHATGEEVIHVGPAVLSLDDRCVEMVLRHEILHRSMYHAFGERYTEPGLSNLTLDICINRMLYDAYPEPMRDLSEAIYPEESKASVIALADCSANPAALPPDLAELWTRIWDSRGDPLGAVLRPSSLYYRLLRIGAEDRLPQSYLDDVATPDRRPTPRMRRAIEAATDQLGERLPEGSGMAGELSTFSVAPRALGSNRVEMFVRKMRIRRVVAPTARALRDHLERGTRIQPFPGYPTRLGLAYQAAGLQDTLRLWWNRETVTLGARLALGIYVDVSGSMIASLPIVSGVIDALKDYPVRVAVFDHEVREVEVADLVAGRITGGGGTDFDLPIEDLLENRDLHGGVLITDGFGWVSPEVETRLRYSGKPLHLIEVGAAMYQMPEETRSVFTDAIFVDAESP